MKHVLAIMICLLFGTISVSAMSDYCRRTTKGTDFWFGFMKNVIKDLTFADCNPSILSFPHFGEIIITSERTANYTIKVGPMQTLLAEGTVTPGVAQRVKFNPDIEAKNAIHLTSTDSVSVYALNFTEYASDIAMIYPVASLGKEYYAMCGTPDPLDNVMLWIYYQNAWVYGSWPLIKSTSEFIVVATQDRTVVEIFPKVKVNNSDKPFSITLNRGEQYLVTAEDSTVEAGTVELDLTGSYIKSNKPIALFSGTTWTQNPPGEFGSPGHLYEQIPPVQTWGRKFLAVPFKGKKKDTWRILASSLKPTTVRVTGRSPVVLNRGEYTEFTLTQDEPSFIESDKPVLVAQFSSGGTESCDTCLNKPSMVIVSPVNQASDRTEFVTCDYLPYNYSQWCTCRAPIDKVGYSNEKFNISACEYYINVIAKDDAAGKIFLDKNQISFISLPGSDYGYAQVKIASGPHLLESTEPGKGFVAYAYNYWDKEVRSYPLAQTQDLFVDLATYNNTGPEIPDYWCWGDTLKAGDGFDTYTWNGNIRTTSWLIPQTSGWYKVNVTTNDGCNLTDSIELKIDRPYVNLGNDRTICIPGNNILDAGSQWDGIPFRRWQWSPASDTTQTIPVTEAGNYKVEITDQYGCKASDEVKISTDKRPVLNLSSLDTLVCGSLSDQFSVTADKGSLTVERLSDHYLFNSLDVSVPAYGSYQFRIMATDQYQCSSEEVINVGFYKIPKVDININDTKCYGYNLEASYIGDAVLNSSYFTWVFGNDTINQAVGAFSQDIPLGFNQVSRDLKLTVSDQGCTNSKTIGDIKVTPLVRAWADKYIGCEPFTAQFRSSATEPVTYDWSFGDGIRQSGAVGNPSHTYLKPGSYPVTLKVITGSGCVNESRMDSLIIVGEIPEAGFSLNPEECLSPGEHQLFYMGSADPNDTYRWDLSAFDPVEIIRNPGITQGPFVFNLKNKPSAPVKLNVVSKYGCISNVAEMTVRRKPDFSMQLSDNRGCSPLETGFEAVINDGIDRLSFTWDFGDGTKGYDAVTTHSYRAPGTKYDIMLTALSSLTGCAETVKTDSLVIVYSQPKADFKVEPSIVYNTNPEIRFINQSSGAMQYSWDFGDGLISIEKNPSHKYPGMGSYKALLEVYNSYNCMDTLSRQIYVAFAKIFPPNAFSPNAANPVDREFRLMAEGVKPEGYHMSVLSRWNDIVFETKNEIKGWDGRMANGNFAPMGNYVWVLDFFDTLGKRHHQTGTVTLIY